MLSVDFYAYISGTMSLKRKGHTMDSQSDTLPAKAPKLPEPTENQQGKLDSMNKPHSILNNKFSLC